MASHDAKTGVVRTPDGLLAAETGALLEALEAWRAAPPKPSGGPSAAEYRAAKILAHRAACLLRRLGIDA